MENNYDYENLSPQSLVTALQSLVVFLQSSPINDVACVLLIDHIQDITKNLTFLYSAELRDILIRIRSILVSIHVSKLRNNDTIIEREMYTLFQFVSELDDLLETYTSNRSIAFGFRRRKVAKSVKRSPKQRKTRKSVKRSPKKTRKRSTRR